MTATELPASPAGMRAIELTPDRAPLLQRFFEANPEYYLDFYGEPPRPDEGVHEITEPLPAGWPFTRKWLVGWLDANGELVAMANVVSDLLAPRVWHVGFFVVATARRGTGLAGALYESLERWMAARGAEWLRLGVVAGNARGERFWEARGFVETRLRPGTPYRSRVQTMRVMVKPLAGGSIEEYLRQVARDRPEG